LIEIVAVNQRTPDGQSVPANIDALAGQVDVFVKVDPGEEILQEVSVRLAVGDDTMARTHVLGDRVARVATDASANLLVFTLNTALFNATTGVPTLHNGPLTISATGTSTTGTTLLATSTAACQLNNADAVVLAETFAAYTDADGRPTSTSTTDAEGRNWKRGSVTVAVLPILYSGRQMVGGSIAISIPGANGVALIRPIAPGAVTATWSATATTGLHITGLKLVGDGFEADGITPRGVTPSVVAIDDSGKDLALKLLNFEQPGLNLPDPTFRLDNEAGPQIVSAAIVTALRTFMNELSRIVVDNPEALHRLEWRQMEQLIAHALESVGFDVTLTPGSKDGGKDIIARCKVATAEHTYYIEVKHWDTQRVGAERVEEFVEVNVADETTGGVFISTSGYTSAVYRHRAQITRGIVRLGTASTVFALVQHSMRARDGIWRLENLPEILFAHTE